MMFKSLCRALLVCLATCEVRASGAAGGLTVGFAGVFDEGIYDMSPLPRMPVGRVPADAVAVEVDAAADLIADPLELLKIRKEQQLANKYLSILEGKIEGYLSTIRGQAEGEGAEGIARVGADLHRWLDDTRRNILGGFATTGIYTLGSWLGRITAVLGTGARLAGEAVAERVGVGLGLREAGAYVETAGRAVDEWGGSRRQAAAQVDNAHIEFEVLKLRADLFAAQRSLDFEPVGPLEQQYVLRKPYFATDLQTAIERSLILYRECTGHLLAVERTFVEQALSLPTAPRRILRPDRRTETLRELLVMARERFATFSPAIQRELLTITADLANFSMVPDTDDGARRVVRYFYGAPGGGKTTTVEALAELVGLPCVRVSIRSMEDLSGPPLRGEDRLSFSSGNKHGWFLSPLLQKVRRRGARGEIVVDPRTGREIRETYSNPILLIDDIDLELGAAEALATLKLYLDPTTREFQSPYFLANIDVSRMSVFVTSNQEIPGAPADESMDKYAALRGRVKQVHFPIFGITESSPVLQGYVRSEARMRGVNLRTPDMDVPRFIAAAKERLEAAGSEPDMRNMRATIAELMTEVSIDAVGVAEPDLERLLNLSRIRQKLSLALDKAAINEGLLQLRALHEERAFPLALEEMYEQACHAYEDEDKRDVLVPHIRWLAEGGHHKSVVWAQENLGVTAAISRSVVTSKKWTVGFAARDDGFTVVIEGAEPEQYARQWAWTALFHGDPVEKQIRDSAVLIDADSGHVREDFVAELRESAEEKFEIPFSGAVSFQEYLFGNTPTRAEAIARVVAGGGIVIE